MHLRRRHLLQLAGAAALATASIAPARRQPVGKQPRRDVGADLRERIAADFRAVLAADAVLAERIAATGQVALVQGPNELAAGIAEQRAKLALIAKALDIRTAQ